GNYFGPPLNRVARLLASGSGGQILCSQAAAEVIGADLPADVVLTDLGEHRLADLALPERIFQVAHPDVPSEFPPLRTLGAHRHNLPVSLTPFVGRARELEELGRLLGGSRLVTLTGVGGAGKTRLALQTAAATADAHPDGVWMVELAPVREGTQVPLALAAAVTIETDVVDTPDAVAERLLRHLAGRRTLLLFDNCEHVLEPVARLVHAVLTHCPAVTVIATSRELLGLPGEVVWKVPPLHLPPPSASHREVAGSDAVGFFCERARAARPGFELDGTNAAAVARICRRLDGIPLALELAAARVAVLSPEQLAKRLDDRFRLLSGRERIAVPRHQTLRATIDWSYELLSPEEQAALARLAVFPDTFDLEAAEAVMSADDGDAAPVDALDVLCALVGKSLVVVHSEGAVPRYRLLETIRQYGTEKLMAAGEDAATRRRHRDAFIARIESWRGTILGADFLAGAFADSENIRAALEWSWAERDADAVLRLLMGIWVWWGWGGHPESQDWLRILSAPEFSAPELADHPGQVEVIWARAFLHSWGDDERQDRLMEEAAALARRIKDADRMARIDWAWGELKLLRGKTAEARPLFESSLVIYERLGFSDGVGWCHDHLGWAAIAERDYDRARTHFERAVEFARRDPLGEWLVPHALAALAPLVALSGEGDSALGLAEEAIGAARELPARAVLAMALTRAAETAVLAGQLERATAILVELLGVLADMASRRWVADALELTALVREGEGGAEPASELFGAAEALRETTGEGGGGARVIAGAVHEARHRLAGTLGDHRFQEHLRRGRILTRELAIAQARARIAVVGD
ncbi:MAG: ATP-binding protein, partial [Acidimicrobiia bacterium]